MLFAVQYIKHCYLQIFVGKTGEQLVRTVDNAIIAAEPVTKMNS